MKPGSELKEWDEQAYRVAYLIAGFIRGTLTETEHDELDAWVETSDENMQLFEELTDEKNLEANLAWMDKIRVEKKLRAAKGKTFSGKKKTRIYSIWGW